MNRNKALRLIAFLARHGVVGTLTNNGAFCQVVAINYLGDVAFVVENEGEADMFIRILDCL